MKIFRNKILVTVIACLSAFALLNISVQFGKIIDCFPGINVSYLLAEELTETEGGESEKGQNTVLELDLLLSASTHEQHSLLISKSLAAFFHTTDIPLHPFFDKVTPPPKA